MKSGHSRLGPHGWFGALLMLFFGALVIAGIVLLIIWAMRASTHHSTVAGDALPPGAVRHDGAVAIAKRGCASGEITTQEYGEILPALGG